MKDYSINPIDILANAFDTIIDVRSPAEFAEDHVPGAINCPVLSNEERAEIGTLYKKISPFAGRKRGAILTARNIASAIEMQFLDKPKNWRPLVYCWRGGQRSGAFQIILREIGWDAARLNGGYKAWRGHVIASLVTLPSGFQYNVIEGPTGAGKTLLLRCLADLGAQVLDLEYLAGHKGSVLGGPVGGGVPSSRKNFDTQLYAALSSFDPSRPVWIESESKRIGNIHLPDALMTAMVSARRVHIAPPCHARVDYLISDYADLINNPDILHERLTALRSMHAREKLDQWSRWVDTQNWSELVMDLLNAHYDPLYTRGRKRTSFTAPQHHIIPKNIDVSTYRLLAATLADF